MTEKRFTKDDTFMFSAIKDNGEQMTVKEVVECLNNLHEEKQTMITEFAKTIRTYEDEIRRLKGRIQEYEEMLSFE